MYTALETGTVDGATDPLITILVMKFNEVQKYLTLTRHQYNPQIFIIGKKFWDQLGSDEQKALQEAAIEAALFERKVSREKNAQALEELNMKLHCLPWRSSTKLLIQPQRDDTGYCVSGNES